VVITGLDLFGIHGKQMKILSGYDRTAKWQQTGSFN
jgi:hypothetical protein